MYIVTKEQFEHIIDEHPEGGVVFSEGAPECGIKDLMVTDGVFGATCVVPYEGEVFDWDWNIKECHPSESFVIYDNNDVLQMIQILTKGLRIKLNWNTDFYDT